MKRTVSVLGIFGGVALLAALAPVSALAHTDVNIDLGLGVYGPEPAYVDPPPVYYEPPPVYYAPPPPVYYGPRVIYRYRDWDGRHWRGYHDRGEHRGHRHHDDD